MDKTNRKARIESLAALLDARAGHASTDATLARLAGLTDPDSIRRRIHLLLGNSRYADAAQLVKDTKPDPAFIEVALRALIFDGQGEEALRQLGLVPAMRDEGGTLARRATAALAGSLLDRHYEAAKDTFRTPLAVKSHDQKTFSAARKLIAPFVEQVLSTVGDKTTIDLEVLTIYSVLCGLLGVGKEADTAMAVLVRHAKGPRVLLVASLVIMGRLRYFDEILSSLKDFDGSENDRREASFAAAVLLANWKQDFKGSFDILNAEFLDAAEPGKRARLFVAMLDISQAATPTIQAAVAAIAKTKLDDKDSLLNACMAKFDVRQGDIDGALARLDRIPLTDNPFWLETKAKCLDTKGDQKGSLECLHRTAELTLAEPVLIQVADLAYRIGDLKKSVSALSTLAEYYPWYTSARKNLAATLAADGQIDRAIREFESLSEMEPDDMRLRSELGRLYMTRGRLEDAEDVFRYVNSKPEPPVQAVLLWSQVLRALGRMPEAFGALERNRDRFWTNKDFLGEYLTCGYSAGREAEAHEALMALDAMRQQGTLEPERLRHGTLEDLLKLAQQNRKRQEEVSEKLLRGEIPWTFAAEISNMSPIWNWSLRTQAIRFDAENRQSRSAFTLYSTNSFGVDATNDDAGELREIAAPAAGGAVALDISAAITLHKLGFIPTLAKHFSEVIVPDQILANMAQDSRALLPHQLSSLEGAVRIRTLVDTGAITLSPVKLQAHVDEYKSPAARDDLPLSALSNALQQGGLLDSNASKQFELIARRHLAADQKNVSLKGKISLDIETAMSLFRMELLEIVVKSFNVSLLEPEYQALRHDLTSQDARREAYESLQKMISELRQLPNIKFEGEPLIVGEGVLDDSIALGAYQIAQTRGIPLFADDRVLQAMLINERRSTNGTAFGTDRYLERLHKEGVMPVSSLADAFMTLMQRRYRFLIPSAPVLEELFNRYPTAIPGMGITVCAKYMHASFADPGLFAAPEKARVPASVAMRQMLTWTSEIADFLSRVITRDDVSAERAVDIAKWVGEYMVPAVPANILGRQESILGSHGPRAVVAYTLLQSGAHKGKEWTPRALKALGDAVGLTDQEYERVVAEVIENAVN